MLKKINAIFAYITGALILMHTITMGLTMLGKVELKPIFAIIGMALTGALSIHIFISLFIMFFNKGNVLQYAKLNKSTIEQRISAILLLLFIHIHGENYFSGGNAVAPGIYGFVTKILFSTLVMSHFMPSIDKGLITLGIYNKTLVYIIKAIALSVYIFTLVAISVCFLGAIK